MGYAIERPQPNVLRLRATPTWRSYAFSLTFVVLGIVLSTQFRDTLEWQIIDLGMCLWIAYLFTDTWDTTDFNKETGKASFNSVDIFGSKGKNVVAELDQIRDVDVESHSLGFGGYGRVGKRIIVALDHGVRLPTSQGFFIGSGAHETELAKQISQFLGIDA